ncbi:MAG TPA: hypothetical protein VFB72_20975 [Verrucomicrobiae bacterium]|nr:hypothetical protein [Verrucomicrobiae bacterium]
MIPREILKKIRQIEIRTNRFAVLASIFQLRRVPARVKNRKDHNTLRLNHKINHKWETIHHDCALNLVADIRKLTGVVGDALEITLNDFSKLLAQTVLLFIVKLNGFLVLPLRNTPKNDRPHFLYFASNFALTSLRETTSLGLSKCSWRRWSINSASPGRSSLEPAKSFQRLRQILIFSARGSARASLMIESELMSLSLSAKPYFASL